MRMMFTIVGLVLALGIVAVLAKKQLAGTSALIVPVTAASGPGATPRQIQAQQAQDEIKQAMEAAMQKPREPAEEAPKP